MLTDQGYEPKIVFITMLLGFFTFFVKYTDKNKKISKPVKKPLTGNNLPSPIEISETIKKYDKLYYRVGKYYFDIFMVLLIILITYGSIKNNERMVENYEKYLSGEVLENFSEDFLYNENGGLKTVEEFKVDRNQIVAIFVIGLLFFFSIVIKPAVLNFISKRLRKKLEFVYMQDDFEDYSIKTNEYLKNYQFLVEAILLDVIYCFTRVTQNCFLHDLAHQSITRRSA